MYQTSGHLPGLQRSAPSFLRYPDASWITDQKSLSLAEFHLKTIKIDRPLALLESSRHSDWSGNRGHCDNHSEAVSAIIGKDLGSEVEDLFNASPQPGA